MQKTLLILGLMFLAASCVDEIALSVPASQQEKLAVVGSIKKQDSIIVSVQLSRSVDVTNRLIPNTEKGAIVHILDENSNTLFIPEVGFSTHELVLREDDSFQITTGKSYKLSIQLSSGERYESAFEPLLSVPKSDSMSFRVAERSIINESGNIVPQNFIEVLIHTPVVADTSKSLIKWDFECCYQIRELPPPPPAIESPKTCYITQVLNTEQIVVFNGSETSQNSLNGFLLTEEPIDSRFGSGFYFTVYQQSISPSAYEYWGKVSQIVARTGSLFEPPAGIVPSNIHNINNPDEEVLGYFYCSEVETLHKKVELKLQYKPLNRCSQFPSYAEAEPYCRNCLLWTGSSLEKPDYWE